MFLLLEFSLCWAMPWLVLHLLFESSWCTLCWLVLHPCMQDSRSLLNPVLTSPASYFVILLAESYGDFCWFWSPLCETSALSAELCDVPKNLLWLPLLHSLRELCANLSSILVCVTFALQEELHLLCIRVEWSCWALLAGVLRTGSRSLHTV